VDGLLDDEAWKASEWTDPFIDITGDPEKEPEQQTRVKMVWDDSYLYIGAELEEKNIWATLRQRDTVIFYDNDFEVFIDPDGDTHRYYEFEINAYGTVWDLLMNRPYRDGGPAITGWDIKGLLSAIYIQGTINDPATDDEYWTIELAFPWEILKECAAHRRKPADGEQWRINFARVDWEMKVENRIYRKKVDPQTGKSLPPLNRVWSAQERIDMHAPETWGFVQFSDEIAGTDKVDFYYQEDEEIKWVLRELYKRQRTAYAENGEYAESIEDLGFRKMDFEKYPDYPNLSVTPSMYEITMSGYKPGTTWRINQEGRIWQTN
jgi:hypothetical protein